MEAQDLPYIRDQFVAIENCLDDIAPLIPAKAHIGIELAGPGEQPALNVHGVGLAGIDNLRRAYTPDVEVHGDDLGIQKWAEAEVHGVGVTFFR